MRHPVQALVLVATLFTGCNAAAPSSVSADAVGAVAGQVVADPLLAQALLRTAQAGGATLDLHARRFVELGEAVIAVPLADGMVLVPGLSDALELNAVSSFVEARRSTLLTGAAALGVWRDGLGALNVAVTALFPYDVTTHAQRLAEANRRAYLERRTLFEDLGTLSTHAVQAPSHQEPVTAAVDLACAQCGAAEWTVEDGVTWTEADAEWTGGEPTAN